MLRIISQNMLGPPPENEPSNDVYRVVKYNNQITKTDPDTFNSIVEACQNTYESRDEYRKNGVTAVDYADVNKQPIVPPQSCFNYNYWIQEQTSGQTNNPFNKIENTPKGFVARN